MPRSVARPAAGQASRPASGLAPERCAWATGAALSGPEPLRRAVERAYARAARSGDLCLDDADDGLRLGHRFGPDPGPARLITRTGGSTGRPRRVIRTQASWTASFAVMAARHAITPADRYGVLGDLSHSLAFYALAEGLHLGAGVALTGAQAPAAMARALAEAAVTVLYATPTQLRALDFAADPGLVLPGIRLLMLGGGPLDGVAGRAAMARFPSARTEVFYGTSETSFLTLGPPAGDGAAPCFPGVDLAIRTADGHPAAPGQSGAVWAGGPYLASGYAEACTPRAGALRVDGAGRISLGERGTPLAGGRVRLEGRGAQMVTVADRNVFPAAVEHWLLAQEGVGHAAVLPRPDTLRGHRLEAAICWRGGDLGALRAALRAALGPAATPARLVALDDWPLLPSGKTDLARLRAVLGTA